MNASSARLGVFLFGLEHINRVWSLALLSLQLFAAVKGVQKSRYTFDVCTGNTVSTASAAWEIGARQKYEAIWNIRDF